MPVLTEAERHALAMRLVGDFEARRFHVELSTAELVGGGTIAGRVHRDRELAAGPIVVRARCVEAWREAPPRVPIVPGQPLDAPAALARPHAVVGGAGARRARRGALGRASRSPCRPSCRPPSRRARSPGATRSRHAGRCACARTSARSRCRSATARCCSSPGCRCRCGSREPSASIPRPRSASTAPRRPTSAGRASFPGRCGRGDPRRGGRRAGRTLLELGAGTGKLTRALTGSGARVIALEPVASMRACWPQTAPAAEPLDAVAEAIPLGDASVDAVFAAQAYHWFDPEAATAEVARVLRPGGRGRADLEPARRERRLDARAHAHPRRRARATRRATAAAPGAAASTAIPPSRRSRCAPGRTAGPAGATSCWRASPP